MPYFIFNLEDRVVADGKPGTVIAKGSEHNRYAHYFVRHDDGTAIWYSRDEVVPESYWQEKNEENTG